MTDWPAPDNLAETPSLADASGHVALPPELIGDDPIAWIEQHFYIPETRGSLILSDHQKQALRHALAKDDDGLYQYSTIVWSDIKKSAKSVIAAAVVLWRAFQIDHADGWGSIYVIANDLKQADSRVAYYLRRAIQLNPLLRGLCRVRIGSYKVTLPNQTFIEAIPIDPSGEAGSNADMVVFSELWGAHSKAQAQMWTEATLPPNKFGKSFRWVETYAGVTGEAPILEQLYDQAINHGRRLDDDLEIYDNPTARLLCMWNTIPRLPWQTEAYYDQERATLLPSEFDRVHRNQWSDGGADAFLSSIALWDACKEDLPPLGPHEPCILALDGAESNDTFGTGLVTRHARGLAVRYARGYVPEKPGMLLDDNEIEIDIRELGQHYAIQELAYDPALIRRLVFRLQQPATLYRKAAPDVPLTFPAFPAPCVPFNQGRDREIADKGLFDLITTRTIAWDEAMADATALRSHIANANRKVNAQSRTLRIVRRTYVLKIDLAVMLSMACARASAVLPVPTKIATPARTPNRWKGM